MEWKEEFNGSPANFKKVQRFDDFVTVDWVEDTLQENKRHLLVEDQQRRGRSQHENVIFARYPFLEKLLYSCQSWIVLAAIGIVIGLIAACLNIITQWLADIKTGHCSGAFYLNKSFCCWGEDEAQCSDWTTWTNSGIMNYLLFVLISTSMAFAAAFIVKYYGPSAAGSGISEIKVIVSGFVIDGFLDWWTLVIKSLGLPLAIASGLSVGKEGPSVHYAVCVGNCISKLFDRFRRSHANARHFLTAASAAGVAVAFGSPIGGVLFSIEEISNVFQLSTMFRSYFCCLVATSVLSAMNPFRTGQLVMFEVSYDQNWHYFEIPFFVILGLFGGVYGLLVSKYNVQWVALRQKYLKQSAIKEVVVLASLTALVCYFCEFLRLDMTEEMELLFHECSDTDGSPHRLCKYDTGQFKLFMSLIYATIMRMVLVVVSYGCKVPCGIFVPSMAAGATFGRAIGIVVLELYRHFPNAAIFTGCDGEERCIVPGTYAFLGAGAALSGITHLRVAVVVIMFELTGALRYIVPTMIVVAATKSVSDRWPTSGIADQMIKFNGIPYIDAKEDHTFHGKRNKDAMTRKTVSIPLTNFNYAALENLLRETNYSSYPVVTSLDYPILVGFIGRAQLTSGINSARRAHGGIVDADTLCHFVLPEKLEAMSIPKESYESDLTGELQKDQGEVIHFEHSVNFAPLIVDINSPLETTLDILHKIGPKLVFVNDAGLFAGLITRKDIVKYEIFLHEIDGKPAPLPGIEDKAWELICRAESFFYELIVKAVGEKFSERYLRLPVNDA